MPYIRTKIVKGITYFYLCESIWENGKSHQRVIAYLGEFNTVKAALQHWTEQLRIASDEGTGKHARDMICKLAPYL